MKKLFIATCALLLSACTKEYPVRIVAEVEDAVISEVAYAPVSVAFPREGTVSSESAVAGWRIPDEGEAYFVKVTFLRTDSTRTTQPLLLMPGERLRLTGRAARPDGVSELKIDGSELYARMAEELEEIRPKTARFAELYRMRRAGAELTAEQARELDSLSRWSMAYPMNRICKAPESPVSALYLFSCMDEPEGLYEKLYAKFPEEVRNGKYKVLFDAATPEKVRALKNGQSGKENE